jgi:serine/threonine-protein kinase
MHDQSTIEYTPGRTPRNRGATAAPARDPFSEGVAFVLGGATVQTAQTQALLRSRLRAVAWIYLAGHLAFLLRALVIRDPEPLVGAAQVAATLVVAGSLALLAPRRGLSPTALRSIELALFGTQAVFFAFTHYRLVMRHAARGDMLQMLATGKDTMLFFVMLIVTYGLFIPNTWRRAALVVAGLSVPPLISTVLLRLANPATRLHTSHLLTFEMVSDNLLFLGLGAVVAIYGAHVIHRLQVEAFQARRLGQYRLGHRLGSGGMGEVYLAEHQLLKRPTAIKLISPERAADPTAMARFEREVRVTARLTHPNTIEIYDYGRTDDGTFYYAMEYLRGFNLAELVERFGPQPPARVVYLLRQACSALAEAHGVGLVHRDIKPANIFASVRGGLHDFVKLLDFGLVKPLFEGGGVDLSLEGTVAGSPLFMAPEQASGEHEPDRRADIYALGAVGYFLLTGRPPFGGRTVMQVVIAHARDAVEPPSSHRPDVPADLEDVLLRCLAKDPGERQASAEALEAALAACACAGDWDREAARAWWDRLPPAAADLPSGPAPAPPATDLERAPS